MPHDEKPGSPTVPQGLAGGPGPSPPGVDDGTPKPATEAPDAPLAASDERAAARQEETASPRADREEPDPS